MQFVVEVIKVPKKLSADAQMFLEDNCIRITRNFFFFEGDYECCVEDAWGFERVGRGEVPSLGGLTELRAIADECCGVAL